MLNAYSCPSPKVSIKYGDVKGMAMLQISEQNLKDLESTSSRILVGESCKIIEEIEKQSLSTKDSLALVKSLLRNKIYESYRSHSLLISKFSEGVTFMIDFIHKPNA